MVIGQSDLTRYQNILETRLDNLFTVFEQRLIVKQKVLQALIDANNLKLINELRTSYTEKMKQILTQNRNISFEDFEIYHFQNKTEAIDSFNAARADNDQSFHTHLRSLEVSIEEVFSIFRRPFDRKNNSWLATLKEVMQIVLEFTPFVSQLFSIRRVGPRNNRGRRW